MYFVAVSAASGGDVRQVANCNEEVDKWLVRHGLVCPVCIPNVQVYILRICICTCMKACVCVYIECMDMYTHALCRFDYWLVWHSLMQI